MTDSGSTPVPKTVLFLCVAFVIVSAAHPGVDLPFTGEDGDVQQNVTLGDRQRSFEGETESNEPGVFEGLFFRSACVLTLGIAELTGDACSKGFAGTLEKLKNVKILGTVVEGMTSFVSMLATLVTFNVPGAPVAVRFVIGTAITGTIAYSVVRVVRGGG